MTGGTETCILIDGTVRRTPVAEIDIEMPYYSGRVNAVCMENPLYDVIIGNVPRVRDENNEIVETQAVITRSQAKKQAKPVKPLKVIENLGDDVTREKLVTLQQQDTSLAMFLKEAEQTQSIEKSDVYLR